MNKLILVGICLISGLVIYRLVTSQSPSKKPKTPVKKFAEETVAADVFQDAIEGVVEFYHSDAGYATNGEMTRRGYLALDGIGGYPGAPECPEYPYTRLSSNIVNPLQDKYSITLPQP
jgi:hypothetical protein